MRHAKQRHNRRSVHDSLESIHRAGRPGNGKSDLCLQVHDTVMATVQHGIAEALADDLSTYWGLAHYEQLPWGRPPESTRRGRYQRAVLTPYGRLAALRGPTLRRGNGALPGQRSTRDEQCWGPRREQHVLGYCVGHSRRAGPEALAVTRGERLAGAAGHRMVFRVSKPRAACTPPPLARPPRQHTVSRPSCRAPRTPVAQGMRHRGIP